MFSRWRAITLVLLFCAPILFLVGAGIYLLWDRGWSFYAWWPLAASFALAYVLAWYWQRKGQLIRYAPHVPLHWTERDRAAWKLVEDKAEQLSREPSLRLDEISFYQDTAMSLARDLARFYYPKAKDPFSALTIPEILAVVELAAHDLAETVHTYVPGSHLLTISQWRKAKQAADWYEKARDAYWLVSAFISPLKTGLQYAGSKAGLAKPFQMLQENLYGWFAKAFIHRLGWYLIELNSGRLKIGVQRYRELSAAVTSDGKASDSSEAGSPASQVTITLVGQVKAGKSSLINALLGAQRAATDVLPETDEITRYELRPEGIGVTLTLLDTVGYGHAGPREDQLRVTENACQKSDLILLVLHATNPGRRADHEMLERMKGWFASRPNLKPPPLLGVLTHIDLLSPAMEWSPPYDWQRPKRLKEEQIAAAVTAGKEQLGDQLLGIVPVCTAPGKLFGIEEWLLPTVIGLLDELHAVALLRCLHAEIDQHKVRKVFSQMLASSRQIAKAVWQAQR